MIYTLDKDGQSKILEENNKYMTRVSPRKMIMFKLLMQKLVINTSEKSGKVQYNIFSLDNYMTSLNSSVE